ncbi:MAG: efflux RND transporter permease subunit [Desulfovibrio sp.]|uniref:efflux RND transporter permease subunit n=1 Tax=Desulfovibrio sp. 7SRBS1 TaxID=3378064 RepID=UPI003B4146EA
MVNFFIERPIFASVLSIIITLTGLISIFTLPIAQYPQISPPTVQVSAQYTGADSQVVEETVATPIEEQVNGAQDMLYMNSISSNDGRMTLTVTFDISRDLELATVDVQNRLSLATPQLPQNVVSSGVSVKKQSPDMLMAINLLSPDNRYNTLFLNNYAKINLYDALKRIPGVGDVNLFGDMDYGMRIWLNPDKMAKLGLTASDVISAVTEQNVQAPAGQIGQPPAAAGQEYQMSVRVKGRLDMVDEFANIIIRANPDGSMVHVKDVARVELGSKSYTSFSRLNAGPAATMMIYQLPGANALDVANALRAQMKELSAYFPEGMKYHIPFDTTRFVNASIAEVLETLYEAMIIVFLVVFIFLQNFRATLIPMIAVPVSLIGTFALFQVLEFSINTLTLFGCVLAIGIVVDDAIVVVEAVQRIIDEEDIPPREATKKAMKEVAGAIVATTLVLISVFIPVAFMGGITGRLYQQFALTLAVSVGISSLNALTLSPAMSAIILRKQKPMRGPLGMFFNLFNRGFDACTRGYTETVRLFIKRSAIVLVTLVIIGGATFKLFETVPGGFVPSEDQGYYMINVQLPEGASLERTNHVVKQIEDYLKKSPGVADFFSLGGFNIMTSSYSSYTACLFAVLTPWDERKTPELGVDSLIANAQRAFSTIQEATIACFNAPPISGLSTTGGLQFELQDRSGGPVEGLEQATHAFMLAAMKRPEIQYTFTPFSASVPQLFIDVDRDKVKKLGIPLDQVFQTFQTYLGGYYVNDFNKYGRTYRVMLQADDQFRAAPSDIDSFYVRANDGSMVPISTLATIRNIKGPEYIRHFNLYSSVEITAVPAPGYSTGQAIEAMKEVADANLPQGMSYQWSGIAFQEIASGGQAGIVFGLALLMVFLVLSAQYESWAIPMAVLFAVPLGVFGAILAQWLRGLNNDVYAQIGLVMLIGLAVKNAILIVEFAMQQRAEGKTVVEAALEAAHLRFRPILMTSFAFILGILPLVVASGAGAASRHALGTAVFGGMLAATIMGVFAVPTFYSVIQGLLERFRKKPQ